MMKLLYIFSDPIRVAKNQEPIDWKFGVTGNPRRRLGSYQNSYSSNSYTARFEIAYYGQEEVIDDLERMLKFELDSKISMGGLGHTEWVHGITRVELINFIESLIQGCHYRVDRVPSDYLPIFADNLAAIEALLGKNV